MDRLQQCSILSAIFPRAFEVVFIEYVRSESFEGADSVNKAIATPDPTAAPHVP